MIDCSGMGMNSCRAAVAAYGRRPCHNLHLTGVAFANPIDTRRGQNIISGKHEGEP